MVAIRELLPDDPGDQEIILQTIRDSPELEAFTNRLRDHAQAMFGSARMTFHSQQYGEWDPPYNS